MRQHALLGAWLRRLREARGLLLKDAAGEIQVHLAKISRIETGGSWKATAWDVQALLSLYGVTCRHQRRYLLSLLDPDRPSQWWDDYELPLWLETSLALEANAATIRTWDTQVVPTLLQTPEYALATAQLTNDQSSLPTSLRVETLRLRQENLLRPGGPRLWALIDEAALLRPIGDPSIHEAQLNYLADAQTKPEITIQIVRINTSATRAYLPKTGPFTILRFIQTDLPDITYLHQLVEDIPYDFYRDIYFDAMNRLAMAAAPPQSTGLVLEEIQERTRSTTRALVPASYLSQQQAPRHI